MSDHGEEEQVQDIDEQAGGAEEQDHAEGKEENEGVEEHPEGGEEKAPGEDGEPKEGEEEQKDENAEPKEGEEPPVPVDIPAESQKLRDIIKDGLSQLSRTADNSSFAFAYLDIKGKEIENFYEVLSGYPHVRYFMVSENKLKNIDSVASMHSLLSLDASQNELKTAKFLAQPSCLSHLQTINLAQNKIKVIEGLVLPRLRRLVLDENEIKSLEHIKGHQSLEYLSVKKNKLKNFKGLENLTRLKELQLSENEIKVWEGLGPLPQLHTLNLQTNQLTVIPEQLPEIPKLRALVLTENKLKDAKQVPRLLGYKSLQELSISANPFEEELGGDARKQIIISLCVSRSPTIHLSRIISKVNDEPFGEEEQTALIEELVQQAEEERIRKAEEEEERRQKEEEEKRIREEEERERKEKEEEEARERKAREEEEAREKAEAEKARLEREEAEAKEKAEAPPEDDDGKAAVVEPAGDEGQGGDEDNAEGEEEQQ
jgi:hypothetical protein